MTSAGNPMITRCPKCGTAFRVTSSQLQSAKGAVRCGSCLHVFKAQEYLVATPAAQVKNTPQTTTPPSTQSLPETFSAPTATQTTKTATPQTTGAPAPATPNQLNILSAIKPLGVDNPKPAAVLTPPPQPAPAAPTKPVIRTINKSSLGQSDDILISDDMEDTKAGNHDYEFDGFMDIDVTPKSDVSLFERKIRDKDDDTEESNTADESWAEMLIEDEEDDIPQLGILKPKTEEQLADDALASSQINIDEQAPSAASASAQPTTATTPGLLFSLVGEAETPTSSPASDEFVISDELARLPSNQGFKQPESPKNTPDPSLFETPAETGDSEAETPKRQVKTQPKIRAYDGSRTALLMNIIPAPIEFNAKRMRRWYQRKLWPSLSLIALLALTIQVGWFKFDYFSRVEPYRTGYLFLCPYLGCQVPTLIDTRRIIASNLVVREHPDTQGALAVDVMLINNAQFEQPFPDLVLTFTDINENPVAARRFTAKDYLGGELVGRELMPQNQKIHITLDLVDPGEEAVNYHISIARQ